MRPSYAAAALLSITVQAAQAQIYRCGDSYSQVPCAGAQTVDSAPAPSAADRAQATANARRDATLAANLEKDRVRRENQAGTLPLYIPPPAPELDPYQTPEKKATRKLDVFTASAPGTAPKKQAKEPSKGGKGKSGKPEAAKAAAPAGAPLVRPAAKPA